MRAETKPANAHLTEFLYEKATWQRVPLSGAFELSPVCNFNCRMCYVRRSQAEVDASPRPILTLDDWLAIAEEARDAGMLYLLLTGGEPLLWRDFWPLYERLIPMGFLISVNTNGSLIDAQAVERFRRLPPKQINITLYGASDAAYRRLCGPGGSFARVDRAVEGLLAAGLRVKLNCSLTPCNADDLEGIVRYAREKRVRLDVTAYMFPPIRRDETQVGVNAARFSPEETAAWRMKIYRLQNDEAHYARFLEDILKGTAQPPGLDESCIDPVDGQVRCRAGKAAFWITWDGWMTPCGMMPAPKSDLRRLTFGRAWRETVEQTERLRLSGLCGRCPNRNICHPCAAMAFAETGTAAGVPDYLCRVSREMRRIAGQETEHKSSP